MTARRTTLRLIGQRDGTLPRKIPDGFFLWHNHVRHTADMTQGRNGFRYYFECEPVNNRLYMRCHCGWSGLPHYSVRELGPRVCAARVRCLGRLQ